MVYGYGGMAEGMIADFSWSRADAATFFTAFLIGSGIGMISLGWLISRFGVQRPAAILAAIFGISFAAVGVLPPSHFLFWILFFVIGFGGAACTPMPYAVSISGAFDKYRGLASGLLLPGRQLARHFFHKLPDCSTKDGVGSGVS